MMRCAVGASMSSGRRGYDVRLTVRIPMAYLPLVKLAPHDKLADGPYDPECFEIFMQHTGRICAAHKAICDKVLYDWRVPTEAEQQRLAELRVEFDTAQALLERTKVDLN